MLATFGGLFLVVVAENPTDEEDGSSYNYDSDHHTHRGSHFFN
jgi:hypothetical protein